MDRIYAVYYQDGYECESFLGAFESQERANEVRDQVQELMVRFHVEHLENPAPWPGRVEVVCLKLNEFKMPADAQYVLDMEKEK